MKNETMGIGAKRPIEDKPTLLYFCEFPPSNHGGGTILVSRLLADYPAERITVLSGSHFLNVSPKDGRLSCRHIAFPTTNQGGRWNIGRLKLLVDWMLLPFLTLFGVRIIKKEHSAVVVTVAHGNFFIAAAFASILTKVPYILIVHDDWVGGVRSNSYLLKIFSPSIFQFVIERASHIYAVSPAMREFLKTRYGVDSELQMPATGPCSVSSRSVEKSPKKDWTRIRIAYAGTENATVEDSLNLLIELVKGELLLQHGFDSWVLDLYMPVNPRQSISPKFVHDRIKLHGWVSQKDLQKAIKSADILFLPYSFRTDQKFSTTRSFASKTADYLAAGKPILIFAPDYCTLVRYAREFRFAEVVDKPSIDALAQGIANISHSSAYREQLQKNGAAAFELNHNIAVQRKKFALLIKRLSAERS
jgi:glycosyltransferase involved in cell wall biosynthesis